ncbi:MAG: FAD-dependent monooxygenase [Bryobacteraceae bacterium]
MPDTDVFIAGGGPAGLAAAIAARQRGFRVVVADGRRPPIDKACGEGLMPDARRAAAELGIELAGPAGYEFRGIRFCGAGRSVQADFPNGRGLGVRRTTLHQSMVDAAVRAGVELRWDTPVTGIEGIKARWIVGADGSSSLIRQWSGLNRYVRNTHRFAYRQHFATAPWTDYMETHWGSGCQIYVTPVGREEVCLALISRTPQLRMQEALDRHFPELRDLVEGSLATTRERGAVTASTRLHSVTRGNIALIGEASGSVDAITGEGICLSFKQAALLADAMERGDLESYNQAHRRLSFRPHVMSKLMLTLDRGSVVRRLGMGAMSRQPRIFETLLAVHVA